MSKRVCNKRGKKGRPDRLTPNKPSQRQQDKRQRKAIAEDRWTPEETVKQRRGRYAAKMRRTVGKRHWMRNRRKRGLTTKGEQ